MTEKPYAYVFERDGRDYEHVCIDEGTAALYTELESMYEVSIIFWENND